MLILSCLCIMLLSGTLVYPQRRKPSTQKSTGGKTTPAPTEPQKSVARKETVAEKIVAEGICKSPSPYRWQAAIDINIASSHRSEPYMVTFPEVLNRGILLIHFLKAADIKFLYETKSYKTDVFPDTYKKNEAGIKDLLAKREGALKENSGARVSSSDRQALYPVIKAYLIDVAITIQEIPKASMRGNFAEAYKQNEQTIVELAKSSPSEGLSSYSDDKETQILDVMTAYLIDFAAFIRDSHQSTGSSNLTAAYEKNKAKIENLAAATNWKGRGLTGEERDALRSVLEAGSIDVANLLRGSHQASNKGTFEASYEKNATDLESLAGKNWEKDSSSEFANAAPALCQVLTAYKGPK
ncbi:MAG: hypothetical protein ACMG6H_08900 [Acidobacteriota bacterium]